MKNRCQSNPKKPSFYAIFSPDRMPASNKFWNMVNYKNLKISNAILSVIGMKIHLSKQQFCTTWLLMLLFGLRAKHLTHNSNM